MKAKLAAAHADQRFQFQLARIFGKLVTQQDDDIEITGYFWRQSIWVIKVTPRD